MYCPNLPTQPLSCFDPPIQWAAFQLLEAQSNPKNLCSIGTKVVAQMPTDV